MNNWISKISSEDKSLISTFGLMLKGDLGVEHKQIAIDILTEVLKSEGRESELNNIINEILNG